MTMQDHCTRLSRRTFIGGLVASATPLSQTLAQQSEPPPFATVRHQFTIIRGARPVPSVPIPRIDGRPFTLATLLGQIVLVNFWATWCPACRTELPILDRLQQIVGKANLKVVAVAVDRDGRAAVAPFVRSMKLSHLELGLDPGGLIAKSGEANGDTPFALYAMPISYVIGRSGQVEGYIAGEVDWMSEDARRLLAHYINAG